MRSVSDQKLDEFTSTVLGSSGIYDESTAESLGFDIDDLTADDWHYIETSVFFLQLLRLVV